MQAWMNDVPAAIVRAKADLRARMPDRVERFRALTELIEREIGEVSAENAAGEAVPQLRFDEVEGGLAAAHAARIRRRGCAMVRGVFTPAEVAAWNDEIADYIERNDYAAKSQSKAGLDQYFTTLALSRPQIFGLYWSKPQVRARQDERLARVRAALNRLWRYQGTDGPVFDPSRECTYSDRLRRRLPGDTTLGLSPHADGGSVERWCDPAFQRVYHEALFGEPARYDAFDAQHRIATQEIPSPAVCSVFRTFQGWTALTRQGRGDGTLRLIPIANLMAWVVLRALQDDVPADELCGAKPGRALGLHARWHELALPALVSIPTAEPGDTVWWHSDVVHAVEDEHRGSQPAIVMYIGAAPYCGKNADFLPRQAKAFLDGRSCPDFAAEDYEVDFVGRAKPEDLSELGRRQMGLAAW